MEAMAMQRRFLWSVVIVSLVWIIGFSAGTLADGVILPDHPEHGWLSIVYHDVEVTILDGIVTTHVDQLFRNGTSRNIEGRYVFPLPPGAVVSSFTMWVDGEALEARILDADEARSIYEDYVRRAIDPALLEYVGRDTLSARIFPIPAGGERRVEITYSELLSAEGGTYRYRYPLDTERFSARPLERVSISVDLQTTAPLSAVYSPTHALGVVRTAGDRATGLFEEYGVLPSQDFLLYYSVSLDAMGMTLLTYRVPGEDGFFLLVVTPPELAGSAAAIPKDLVFVIDSSGSMSGRKIEQAKQALRFILENLNPDDRFAVVPFSDSSSALQTQLVPVSAANIAQTTAWASRIDAQGGTNIDEALSLAFSLFEATERPKFLIFLTDGEPTVGEVDPVAIAERAADANATDARVFVFGVGNNVNTVLLDQLAQENRGTTTYVLPGENLEVSLSSFYRKIAAPVLADTAMTIDAVDSVTVLDVFDVHPTVLPDLFRGAQLLVLGRFRGEGEARITVAGNAGGIVAAYTTLQTFSSAALEHSFLPRLWAGRKISYLLNQIRLYGESDELVDSVVALSRRYGIITPYTSFLVDADAVSDEEAADAVRQAAAAPATGASAVQSATSLKALSEAETVQAGVEGLRIVEDRTYFFRDGVWVDSEYTDQDTIDVAAYSDAYFELTGIVPWLGPHLAIGERVVVRVDDLFVRIGEGGLDQLTNDVIEALSS
jgi:Ca-activated chloride channel family protein